MSFLPFNLGTQAFIEMVLPSIAELGKVDLERLSSEYAFDPDIFEPYHRLMLDGEVVTLRCSERIFQWERLEDLCSPVQRLWGAEPFSVIEFIDMINEFVVTAVDAIRENIRNA